MNGLSTVAHVIALADQLSAIADELHARVMGFIRDGHGAAAREADVALARLLFDDEIRLRQYADVLYVDAAARVVQSLNLSQQELAKLTAKAAQSIHNASKIADIVGLVASLLSFAEAATKGQAAPIAAAVGRVNRQMKGVAYSESSIPVAHHERPDEVAPAEHSRAIPPRRPGARARPVPRTMEEPPDEGRAPVRFPSIAPSQALEPGAAVVIIVDLLREAAAQTAGAALTLGAQSEDWSSLAVGVTLVSAGIAFPDDGKGVITIRRNAASVPARIQGTVCSTVGIGQDVVLHAQFWDGTRCCGSAVRCLKVGPDSATAPEPAAASVHIPTEAAKPDVTIYITLFDPNAPGSMHWRIVAERFDGLPPRLDGIIALGHGPRTEATQLFKEFANLPRGEHQRAIDGFGERLWKLSPAVFKAAYWALHDHYQRPLTIQFTSDDPYLPWELMRPSRANEKHEPIALRHSVARWIGAYQGWLKNDLPTGALMVVAPHYSSAATQLSITESVAAELIKEYKAAKVPGTRAGLLALLESPPAKTVGMLYFTGHGRFNDPAASMSAIKLEAGSVLQALDVDRDEVQLGKRHGSVVFFNACEVGATGAAFGEVGGWADAFLARQFRAFIAPLWAIDEEDAAKVTRILIDKVMKQRMPIGAALRDIRREHGHESPTFYSYLLYGDVTARVMRGDGHST
jgi:hypothetical protein